MSPRAAYLFLPHPAAQEPDLAGETGDEEEGGAAGHASAPIHIVL